MQLARVIGDVVATPKDSRLDGINLLLLQPIAADGAATGRTLVALDAVGAGPGEYVFFVRGKEASFPFYPVEVPADACIVGIVDHWSTEAGTEHGRRADAEHVRSAGAEDVRSARPEDVRSAGAEDVRSAGASAPASDPPPPSAQP